MKHGVPNCSACSSPVGQAQDTVVAIRRAGERLVITNLHAELYPEISFSVDPQQARGAVLCPWQMA